MPAAGLGIGAAWLESRLDDELQESPGHSLAAAGTVILLIMSTVLPVALYRLTPALNPEAHVCPAGQVPFLIRAQPESHIDAVPADCGLVPRICAADLDRNATDKANDDLVQAILAMSESSPGGIRITSAMDLLAERFGYFVSPIGGTTMTPSGQLVAGCATQIETRNSRLFQINSQHPVVPGAD